MLHHQESPADIDIHDMIEAIEVLILDQAALPDDPGAVEHGIEFAEIGFRPYRNIKATRMARKCNWKAGCDVEATLSVIGGRWKPILIWSLLGRRKRFSELCRLAPNATERMITLQLRELEADGVVSRRVLAEVPPRVEHEVTERGRSLKPVIEAMQEWGKGFKATRFSEERQVLEVEGRCAWPACRNLALRQASGELGRAKALQGAERVKAFSKSKPHCPRGLPGMNSRSNDHARRKDRAWRNPRLEKGAKPPLPDPLKSQRDSLADTDAHGAKTEGQAPVLELDRGCQCQPCS